MMKKILFLTIILLNYYQNTFSQESESYITLETDEQIISDLSFTSNGEALVVADNCNVKIFSTESYQLLDEFENGHTNRILSVDISNNGHYIASAGKDSSVIVWDFMNRKKVKTLHYHKGIVTTVKISPDGNLLASGSSDGEIILYDLNTNEILHKITDYKKDVTVVRFSPDGKYLVAGGAKKRIYVYETESGNLLNSLKGHKSWVRDLVFSPDGTQMISCGDDSKIIIWDTKFLPEAIIQNQMKQGFNWILSTDFDKNKNSVVYAQENGKIFIFSPIIKYNYKIHNPVLKVRLKPNEETYFKLALATNGKGAIILDSRNMSIKSHKK